MSHLTPAPLTVPEAARALGCSPQTVRRLLQSGRLAGHKHGRHWIVWWPTQDGGRGGRAPASPGAVPVTPAAVRQRVRDVGQHLIVVGNQMAAGPQRRGALFLTWRTPRSLRITWAIGRVSPTQRWAPRALGTELPFWLAERQAWRPIMPLLRRYERLRMWCHARLLRIPEVRAVLQDELTRLDTTLGLLAQEAPTSTLEGKAQP